MSNTQQESTVRLYLHPPIKELLVSIAIETARIRPDHWDLEKLKLQHALDRHVHVLPLAIIVTELHTHA